MRNGGTETRVGLPSNLADIVGGTPMVRLTRIAPDCGAELCGKLEAYNPAGSVKDRIGVAMIDAAERDGRIEPGRTTIVEPTSGNTGIALAFVCAARGYELVLTMPQGMSRERETLLRMYGAQVEITESMGGMNEAVDAAERLAGTRDDAYIPDQFSNPANPEIHRRTTAEEIWEQTGGEVDVFVAGVGHGRHDHRLRRAPEGAQPGPARRSPSSRSRRRSSPAAGPDRTGSRASARASCPSVLNRDVIDEIVAVPDEDAIETAKRLAREEGVLAGISVRRRACGRRSRWAAGPSGRASASSMVLPDSGERYVTMPFFP